MTTAPYWLGCSCCGLACHVVAPTHAAARTHASQPARCPRCHEPLLDPRWQHRPAHAQSMQTPWALLLASVLAYVPANLLPVMGTATALGSESHTILGGIVELWVADSWVLAVIVFIASILVPLLKLGSLALLAWSVDHAPAWHRNERACLYRVIDAIGHWSMLDVYVVVLLTAMVQFGSFASVSPEPGLLAFAAMVILSLLATHSLDPRQIWVERAEAVAVAAAVAPAASASSLPSLVKDR